MSSCSLPSSPHRLLPVEGCRLLLQKKSHQNRKHFTEAKPLTFCFNAFVANLFEASFAVADVASAVVNTHLKPTRDVKLHKIFKFRTWKSVYLVVLVTWVCGTLVDVPATLLGQLESLATLVAGVWTCSSASVGTRVVAT